MSIDNVSEFHRKFGFPLGKSDAMMGDPDTESYRFGFLEEELEELDEALEAGDRVKAFDALLDLVYVAYGTALWMGISPEQWAAGFRAVHNANMAKVRVASADESKRGNAFDCKKPEGWVSPEGQLREILQWAK